MCDFQGTLSTNVQVGAYKEFNESIEGRGDLVRGAACGSGLQHATIWKSVPL
jgi:hypothetical protein